MKQIILLITIATLFFSCSKSNRETLILSLWCSHDKAKSNSICLDFESGDFPDGYERLITTIESEHNNGQFKIDGDKIYLRFPDELNMEANSSFFEQEMELTIKNINENSVYLVNSSGNGITLIREDNPR
tara:strand:+ start:541 stop:930 length:390 start_codon:yes stop_codon:yes gene_type:complete